MENTATAASQGNSTNHLKYSRLLPKLSMPEKAPSGEPSQGKLADVPLVTKSTLCVTCQPMQAGAGAVETAGRVEVVFSGDSLGLKLSSADDDLCNAIVTAFPQPVFCPLSSPAMCMPS